VSTLYRRSYRIVVDDVEVANIDRDDGDGLRITFEIERTKKTLGNPNRADVAIYNLAESTRTKLSDKAAGGWVNRQPTVAEKLAGASIVLPGISVAVYAGWGGSAEPIFLGALREVYSERVDADWITTFGAADSEKELKLAKVRKAFKTGTPAKVVLAALADALGVKPGNAALAPAALGALQLPTLMQPLTIVGNAGEEFDRFCRSCGLEWSIQNGELQIMQSGKAADFFLPATSPVFAPDSGLIGQVRLKNSGNVEGKALLTPSLVPGRAFRIESKAVTANFRCIRSLHRGDSHQAGDAWVTEFEGDPL
jgi:hypothetical protein